jgi:hypothetical protein
MDKLFFYHINVNSKRKLFVTYTICLTSISHSKQFYTGVYNTSLFPTGPDTGNVQDQGSGRFSSW